MSESEGNDAREGELVRLVTDKKGEAEIAADLKVRIDEAFKPILALMDEAAKQGLLVRWDAVGPSPPLFKYQVSGLRLEKHY